MRRFHLHIYFSELELPEALRLFDLARGAHHFDLVKIHKHPVGPHPTPTLEAHFKEPAHAAVLEWLKEHRGNLSALIHEDTGDDKTDHTLNSQWMGNKINLNFAFFDLIQQRPDLRINGN